jgi:uncharacterized protein involved in cysteine biosynthesis
MTVEHWLLIVLVFIAATLLLLAVVYLLTHRRRVAASPQDGWLTDAMVQQIIEVGALSERQVPDRALDLEEIAKEEEKFWTETWDEPEHYWE